MGTWILFEAVSSEIETGVATGKYASADGLIFIDAFAWVDVSKGWLDVDIWLSVVAVELDELSSA